MFLPCSNWNASRITPPLTGKVSRNGSIEGRAKKEQDQALTHLKKMHIQTQTFTFILRRCHSHWSHGMTVRIHGHMTWILVANGTRRVVSWRRLDTVHSHSTMLTRHVLHRRNNNKWILNITNITMYHHSPLCSMVKVLHQCAHCCSSWGLWVYLVLHREVGLVRWVCLVQSAQDSEQGRHQWECQQTHDTV